MSLQKFLSAKTFLWLITLLSTPYAWCDYYYKAFPGVWVGIYPDTGPNMVRVEAHLSTLNVLALKHANEAITKANEKNDDLDLKLHDIKFDREFQEGRNIRVYFDLGATYRTLISETKARCVVDIRVAVQNGRLTDVKPIPAVNLPPHEAVVVDCKSEQIEPIAPRLFDLIKELAPLAVEDVLRGLQPVQPDKLQEFMKEDPDWGWLISRANFEVRYCRAVGSVPSLCLIADWGLLGDDFYKIKNWARDLKYDYEDMRKKKIALTASQKKHIDTERQAFLNFACKRNLKPSPRVPDSACYESDGVTVKPGFPAEFEGGNFGDGDITLFAGLLCSAAPGANNIGCRTVKAAQGTIGRFWRSPDRVDVLNDPNAEDPVATFSGDQFNGIVAYLAKSKDTAAFARFLDYLKTTPTDITGERFYKSCTDDKSYECNLMGAEWYFLNLLADKMGTPSSFPTEMRKETLEQFKFDLSNLYWQAVLSPAGFRLHLVGVQVMLARQLVPVNEANKAKIAELNKTAGILAARQPDNPFFRYLHLGKDQSVLKKTNEYCKNEPQAKYTDWAWQRPTSQEAWKESMTWDCYFMYRLLSN